MMVFTGISSRSTSCYDGAVDLRYYYGGDAAVMHLQCFHQWDGYGYVLAAFTGVRGAFRVDLLQPGYGEERCTRNMKSCR